MLENLKNFFKKIGKKEVEELLPSSSDSAKERLHMVLMQDRVNVSVDFLDLMKQDIIDVTKKYIDIDENEMDVRFTNQVNEDGTNGVPVLYANIPIISIKSETKKIVDNNKVDENKKIKTEENTSNEATVTKSVTTVKKSTKDEINKKTTVTKKTSKKKTSE